MKAITVNIIILSMLIVASCRTVKIGEKITSSTDSSVRTEAKIESSVHQESSTNNAVTDNSIVTDNTQIVKTETELSEPDSSGAQHPIKITVTETKTERIAKNDIKANTRIDQKTDSTGVSNSKSEVDQSADKSSEVKIKKEIKTPIWVWLSISILSIGLVVLAYFILKRFGLVK